MVDQIVSGKSAAYRDTSEALHRGDPSWVRRAAHYRMLAECGLEQLIRDDFYGLFEFSAAVTGVLLDAGCGAGRDTVELARRAPGLAIHGVDVSSVALGYAAANAAAPRVRYHLTALERLPFADAVFDYISSHEVIEHVEDPALVALELARVLKPGGVCVVATPNGASLWIEHLRQRVMRACGRRGAPIGADHTRTARYWRRVFGAAGLVVERQIYDGAALEFLLFVAPAGWMPLLARVCEPLRAVRLVRLLVCDRVKFRLRKAGAAIHDGATVKPCCPVCRAPLDETTDAARCAAGHRFARSAAGIVDFTALAPAATAEPPAPAIPGSPASDPAPPLRRRSGRRRVRHALLLGFGVVYGALLLLLAPLALVAGAVDQPFDRPASPRK